MRISFVKKALLFYIILFSNIRILKAKYKAVDGIFRFKIYNFFPKFFPEEKNVCKNQLILHPLFKKICVLEQFKTLGNFDVLLIDKPLKQFYNMLKLIGEGWSKEQAEKEAFAIEKNKDKNSAISMYIFADVKADSNITLEDARSKWRIYLKLNDTKINPNKITAISKDVILEKILEWDLDKKKKIYKVNFKIPHNSIPFISKKLGISYYGHEVEEDISSVFTKLIA